MEWHKLLMTFHSSSLREYLGINYWDVQVCKIHILHEWVHLCNKCWTSYPAAKKRLFRGGQDVLWQRGIRASIQKGWKEESHKREIPRSSDRITKKSLYPRVLVIFNRSFTPNLIIIANIFKALLIWLDFILALNLFRQHNRNIDHLQGIGRQWDPGNQCRVWTIKQILHDTTLS